MQLQFQIIAGPDNGRTFNIADGQTLVVGRGEKSDTQINDPRVSRVHCQVRIDGGHTLLTDKSTAGTAVNGEPIDQSRELQLGDVIEIGNTKLRFQLESATEQTTLIDNALNTPRPQSAVTPLKNLVGNTLAHYRLDKIIAKGTSGMVFKARDTRKDRPAAVKVLAPEFTSDDTQRMRFVRAMKTMIDVRDPHIVELFAAGKNGPYCWAAMQYIDGENLAQVIDRMGIDDMLDWHEVWRVAVHIGRALAAAQKANIVHRNVTPTNILRRSSDKACLLGDLMLAKALEGTLAQQITQPGQLIGDVPYMSPERTRNQDDTDHRSDIYGLGATCYALLTGRPPFESDSLPELVRMVRQDDPPPPKQFQLAVNDQFQDCVVKMLAKRPEQRQQSAIELLRDLERIGRYNNLEADWSDWGG